VAPVLKITTDSELAELMLDIIDTAASLRGEATTSDDSGSRRRLLELGTVPASRRSKK